jgi:putative ABC transport system substrate-binding protein
MRRREFVAGLAVAAWPLRARAQATPTVGFMSSRSLEDSGYLVEAFRQALAEAGFVDGRGVAVEYRWAQGQYERLREIADEFVARKVTMIVTVGGVPSARAAKDATASTPIVFSVGPDPVKLGLVASLNRPGGNATGISLLTTELEPKRLGLVHELVGPGRLLGVLINPNNPPSGDQSRDVQEAALRMNQPLLILHAGTPEDLEAAFVTLADRRPNALLVGADPFFDTQRDRIIGLAARQRLPALYQFREYAAAGGLMSYGTDLADAYRLVGRYVARILKGETPADLPVLQPTKFELVINLKTANALGLSIPPTLLARADEVIE